MGTSTAPRTKAVRPRTDSLVASTEQKSSAMMTRRRHEERRHGRPNAATPAWRRGGPTWGGGRGCCRPCVRLLWPFSDGPPHSARQSTRSQASVPARARRQGRQQPPAQDWRSRSAGPASASRSHARLP